MRATVRIIIGLTAVMFILAGISSGEDKPWFDMQNCELCRVFLEEPMLMSAMHWEEFETENGVVTVTTVKKDLLPAYREAHSKMMKKIELLEKGDTMYLCGMCAATGDLMARGVNLEYFETKNGSVSLMTADTPELIAEIKAFSAKGKEEWKKMEAMKKGEHKQK